MHHAYLAIREFTFAEISYFAALFRIFAIMKGFETLIIDMYAQAYHLHSSRGSVTENVSAWREEWLTQHTK